MIVWTTNQAQFYICFHKLVSVKDWDNKIGRLDTWLGMSA